MVGYKAAKRQNYLGTKFWLINVLTIHLLNFYIRWVLKVYITVFQAYGDNKDLYKLDFFNIKTHY